MFSQELFSDADVVVESASELDFTKAGIIQSSGARFTGQLHFWKSHGFPENRLRMVDVPHCSTFVLV